METTIVELNDVSNYRDGVLIKQWERGNVTMYMHLAKLDGKYSDVCTLEVTDLGNGQKEYNYANSWRPIVCDLETIEFINQRIIPFYHASNIN